MSASSRHRGDLQGLRAVAVLLVVLTHAGVTFLPGGFVGVDVFFVLSGFLITGLLLAEADMKGSVSLVDFYVRRARRILPAAAVTLLATDIAAFLLLNFIRARDAVHDSLFAAGFAANFRFAERGTDYFAQSEPPSPVLHFWSLAVEEQFYLVWPALLAIVLFGVGFRRRRRPSGAWQHRRLLVVLVLLAAISLVWSAHLTATLPAAAYFSPLTRAWELGLGAALAVGASALRRVPPAGRLAMGWAGLLAIALAALRFSDRTPFPGTSALLPTVGAALAIAAGIGARPSRWGVGRLLALRPMRFVGDRSYAFYLWHWPVLILADQYVGYELSVPVKLGLLAGAFALSCVSYAVVEDPIRRTRGRTAGGVVFGVSLAAVLGTAVLSLALITREEERFNTPVASAAFVTPTPLASRISTGATGALPEVVAAVQASRRGDPIPSGLTPPINRLLTVPSRYALPPGCLSLGRSSSSTSKVCRLGEVTSDKLIVLVGDSHALMWLPAVLELAWRDGWAVVPLLRTGCLPQWWKNDNSPTRSCRPWLDWATRQIGRLHPRITLIGGYTAEKQEFAARAATEAIIAKATTLKAWGTVAVIGDPEGLSRSPVDSVLARHASMRTITTTWPASALRPYNRVAAQARQRGIGFIGTRGFLCYQRRCPAVIGHTIAYRDNNHITAAWAIRVADVFRQAFLRAVGGASR